jgi:hypothetical protein
MGFDAAATSPLDFTFRPHADVNGTIPDPTDDRVREFFRAIDRLGRELATATDDVDDDNPDRAETIERIVEDVGARELDAVVELCSGTPSREQLKALPHRVQRAFIDWLITELRNPTRRPATRP